MLRDAALLQLELLLEALDEGLTLKDATPYNVQWRGAQPRLRGHRLVRAPAPGEPWAGYRQFCMLYLYPAHAAGVEGRPLPALAPRVPRRASSRASRAEPPLGPRSLPARACSATSSCTAAWRRRYGDRRRDVKRELESGRLPRGASSGRTSKACAGSSAGSRWEPGPNRVVRVRRGQPVLGGGRAAPRRHSSARRRGGRRWPPRLGPRLQRRPLHARCGRGVRLRRRRRRGRRPSSSCSTGRCAEEGSRTILPLAMDVADPSPNLGWRGLERLALEGRGRPDLVLVPRARPSRRHHGQRARSRASSSGWPAWSRCS